MADPVSWLMIRAGWKVYAADGSEVGKVDEVAGDENADIFDGLAVATSALGKPVYVAAESIASITEDGVYLSLSAAEAGALGEYLEPATSEVIEADNKTSAAASIGAEARKLEGKTIHPVEHEKSFGLIRRIDFFFKRLRGR